MENASLLQSSTTLKIRPGPPWSLPASPQLKLPCAISNKQTFRGDFLGCPIRIE